MSATDDSDSIHLIVLHRRGVEQRKTNIYLKLKQKFNRYRENVGLIILYTMPILTLINDL